MSVISSLTGLRVGIAINVDGEPYLIVENSFMRTAQRRPVMRTKLKNLINGKVIEKTFKPGDKVEEADLEKHKANFLYVQDNNYYFMDNQSFEQFFFTPDQLTGQSQFLKEGADVDVLHYNNVPVSVTLPQKVILKVTEAPDAAKGDTAGGNVTKEVVMENGLKVRAPMFINQGEMIIISTETGEYVGRATEADIKKVEDKATKQQN